MSTEALTFTKKISVGPFCEIFLTSKTNDKKLYATIVGNKSKLHKDIIEYLETEQTIMKELDHPNILKFIESRENSENIYIITEYYNGGTLDAFLKKYQKKNNKPLSEETVQYIMRQIIEGLKYLHNNNIMHRDLKLSNIMLQYDDENDCIHNNIMKAKIKIVDLKFAKKFKKGELVKDVLGSPTSMDPIILGKLMKTKGYEDVGYDEKVDIWSLGIIFYELLVGKNPFEAENLEQLAEKINKGDVVTPETISEEAYLFLNNTLKFYGDKRANIDMLCNYDFLKKNVNQFKKSTKTTMNIHN